MLNQNDIECLERYISGEANDNEIAYVETLFSHGNENPGLQNHLEKDWEKEIQPPNMLTVEHDHLLDRVHHLIRKKENQRKKMFADRFIKLYSSVAAILLLPLIIAGGLLINTTVKTQEAPAGQVVRSVIHAPYGSRVSFILPDGTSGWLNSGSELTYSLPFNNNRKLLLKGEAWFDVARDEKFPLQIIADNAIIKVLGTSFNVSAYKGENYIEVVLQQGKVEFYRDNLAQKVTMLPSEKLVFRDEKILVSTTDPSKYKAWTGGKLIFRGDDMSEVARRIERWYNVKVNLADEDLKKFSFRATFEDDSLEEVLRLLSLTSPIGFKITPRVVNTDGTFEKQIVTLFKKSHNNNKKIK
jgi:transmembrane sensor